MLTVININVYFSLLQYLASRIWNAIFVQTLACWEFPNPLNHTSCELRVFPKRLLLPSVIWLKKKKARSRTSAKPTSGSGLLFSFFVFLQKLLYHFCAVAIDADRLFFDLHRAIGFVIIEACIDCLRVVIRHLPERIFADNRRIHADADLQIKHMQLLMPS